MTMSEFECFILVVFLINCVLNVFVMAYFRMVIKEEKESISEKEVIAPREERDW